MTEAIAYILLLISISLSVVLLFKVSSLDTSVQALGRVLDAMNGYTDQADTYVPAKTEGAVIRGAKREDKPADPPKKPTGVTHLTDDHDAKALAGEDDD